MSLNSEYNSKVTNSEVTSNGAIKVQKGITAKTSQLRLDELLIKLFGKEAGARATAFITPEFMSLSNAEQMAKLQQAFPNVDETKLKETLGLVKTYNLVSSDEAAENVTMPSGDDNNVSVTSAVAAELVANGKNISSVDDLIRHLKSIPKDKLTDSQKTALEFIKITSEGLSEKSLKDFIGKNSKSIEALYKVEKNNSADWDKLTAKERLDKRVDIMISKLVPNAENLSEEDLKTLRIQIQSGLAKASGIKDAKDVTMLSMTIDALETSGKSVNDLLSMKDSKRAELRHAYVVKNSVNVLLSSDLEATQLVTDSDKRNVVLDKMLSAVDENYNSLDDTAKAAKRDEIIDEIAKELFGDEYSSLLSIEKSNKVTEEELSQAVIKKSEMQRDVINTLFAMKESGCKSLKEFMSKKPIEQLKMVENYVRNNGSELSISTKVRYEIFIDRAQDGKLTPKEKRITTKDVISYLEKKEKSGKLTDSEKTYLQELMHSVSRYSELKGAEQFREENSTKYILENQYKNSDGSIDYTKFTKDVLLNSFHVESIEQLDEKQKISYYKMVFGSAGREHVDGLAKTLGLDPKSKFVRKCRNQQFEHYTATVNAFHGDTTAYNDTVLVDQAYGDHDSVKVTSAAMAADFPDNLNAQMRFAQFVEPEYVANMENGFNEVMEPEAYNNFAKEYYSSENINTECKAIYANSSIQSAKDDSTRLSRGQIGMDSGVAEVAEAVAAGAKYVSSPEYKSQYNDMVKEGSKNYSPEQQTAIVSALSTGKTTLSSASSTVENSYSNSQASSSSSSEAKSTSATGNSAGSKTSSGSISTETKATATTSSTQDAGVTQVSSTPQTSQTSQTLSSSQRISNNNSSSSVSYTGAKNQSVSSTYATSQDKKVDTTTPTQTNSTSSVSSSSSSNAVKDKQVQEDIEVAKRINDKEQLLAKIKEFIDTQDGSIKEWFENHPLLVSMIDSESELVEVLQSIAGESIDVEDVKSDKEQLKAYFKHLAEAEGVNAVYDALPPEKRTRFVTLIAQSGSLDVMREFAAAHRGDKSIILTLYQITNDSMLLNYLDSASLLDLYYKGKIADITKIENPEVLAKIVESKLNGGADPATVEMLYHGLKPDDQQYLLSKYPQMKQIIKGTDEWFAAQNKHAQEQGQSESHEYLAQAPIEETFLGMPKGSNQVANWKLKNKKNLWLC